MRAALVTCSTSAPVALASWAVPPRPTTDPLIRKGRDVPLASLSQQARASLQLARAHASGLARYGWPDARTQALASRTDALLALAGERQAHLAALATAVRAETAARREAMRFLRHLRTALPLARKAAAEAAEATAEAPAAGGADPSLATAFLAGGALGRCTARVVTHLAAIAPALARLDDALAPYFPGERAEARRGRVLEALVSARATRARMQAEVPAQTDRAHRLAGALLEAVEDLHRVARLAFEAEPLVREAFSKRWIERGRRRRAGDTPVPVAVA